MSSKATILDDKSSYRRLALACLISLLLHLVLLGGSELHIPALTSRTDTVEVRLMQPVVKPMPEIAAAPVKQARKPKPATLPAAPAPEIRPDTAPTEPRDNPVDVADSPAADAASPEPPERQEAVADDSTENQPEKIVLNEPAAIDMDYDIRRNATAAAAGTTHVSYRQKEDGSYTLKSQSEAKGLVSLFFSGLTQTSEGVVTNKGLKPAKFSYQYGDNEDKSQRASFDWQAAKLTLKTKKSTNTVDLPAGTQDLLSFMYQFRFVPPLEQMNLSVTNGKRVRSYAYGFEGEDHVQTKLGKLRSIHISRSGDEGDEKTELWLAIDYQYLPVKIRVTEKDGDVIEQTVTRIASIQGDKSLANP